jgi:hypothetical protein
VRTAVEARCLQGADASFRHQALAAYFAPQPWRPSASTWNQRKLAELATQQAGAGDTAALEQTLTDARYLEGKLAVEGANPTLADLRLAETGGNTSQAVRHIRWVVRGWADFLEQHPDEVANQVEGRRPQGGRVLPDEPGSDGRPALRLLYPSLPGDPALVRTFEGHTDRVNACAFSPDGQLALSASSDGALRLWDVASGQEISYWLTDAGLQCCAFRSGGHLAMAGDKRGGVHFLEVVGVAEAVPHPETVRPVPAAGPEASTVDAGAVQSGKRRGWWPFGRR